MCQYCKNVNPELILDEGDWKAQIDWGAGGDAYIICSIKDKGFASMTANYCPICGRYLYRDPKSTTRH